MHARRGSACVNRDMPAWYARTPACRPDVEHGHDECRTRSRIDSLTTGSSRGNNPTGCSGWNCATLQFLTAGCSPRPLAGCHACPAAVSSSRAGDTAVTCTSAARFDAAGCRALDRQTARMNMSRWTAHDECGQATRIPGSVIVTRRPGCAFSTVSAPWCSWRARRAIARPKPIPPVAESREGSTR